MSVTTASRRYVIQPGDTLYSIAEKNGISDIQLRSYHNQNAPLSDLIGSTENFTNNGNLNYILLPPEEGTDVSQNENSSQSTASETEQSETQNEQAPASQEEQQSAGNATEHDTKYVVIQKGQAVCDQSNPPNKVPVGFKVDSHSLQHANGTSAEHLIVTEVDTQFQKPSQQFGSQCLKQPNGSSYNPCSCSPVGNWQKTYEKITVLDNKVLTELSELQCSFGGKITVFKHGQTQEVTSAHFNNVEVEELQAITPLVEKPEKEQPRVAQIEAVLPDQDNKTQKASDSYKRPVFERNSNDSVQEITAKIDESIEFKVIKYDNPDKADPDKVSWKIFNGHDWIDPVELDYSEKGDTIKLNFDAPGKYRVLAYGSSELVRQADNRCAIDVNVVVNELNKQTNGLKAGENSTANLVRKGFPVIVQPDFKLNPPSPQELSRVEMGVTDSQGNIVDSNYSPGTGLSFIPENSAKYRVWVRYTKEDGTVENFTKDFEAKGNVIDAIRPNPAADKYRPGTTITFNVSRMRFSPLANDPDFQNIKWKVGSTIVPTIGNTLTHTFNNEGAFIVEAFMIAADGKGEDSYKVNIVKNSVDSFVGGNNVNWIAGREYDVEVKTVLADFDPVKDGKVNWFTSPGVKLGEGQDNDLKVKVKTLTKGNHILQAELGGKRITLNIKSEEVEIKRWCITDKDLDFKSDAGWGEELYALIESTSLAAGQKVHMHLLEYDGPTDSNYIKDLGEVTFDENGIAKAKFTTDEIKAELNKLYFERGKYELFFAVEVQENGVKFTNVTQKERGGKDTVYPSKTVSHSEHETGKITYIDSTKDITRVRFLKPDGKDAYEIIKYGDPIKIKVQTRNLEGTKLKLTLIRNKFGNGLDRFPQAAQVTVKDEKAEWNVNTAELKKKIPQSDWTKVAFWQVELEEADGDKFVYPNETARLADGKIDWTKLMTFQSLKLSDNITLSELAKTNAPVIVGEPLDPVSNNGVCVCKQYDLIWGNKVNCEFRKKVIEISKELWGESKKIEMANGLMAVMNVETAGSFKAHQIMGKSLQDVNSIQKDDFFLHKNDGTKTSRAVGLIQFTQAALEQLGEFTRGTGFDALHEVKLRLAKMGEVRQLDYVKRYFQLNNAHQNIKSPGDIYLHVFAPKGVGRSDDYVLYDKDTDGESYTQNKSVDTQGNNDGKIQRSEILARFNKSTSDGQGNKATQFTCNANANAAPTTGWKDPVDNPISTNFMQSGGGGDEGKHWGLFGATRNGANHAGLDLFATTGTNIYACVDGTVYNRRWHEGYGNTITIKVKDKEAFLQHKKEYALKRSDKGEIATGAGFSESGNIYLFYAHLDSVESFTFGQEVTCGQVLGTTGRSGVTKGTCAPHLHFEIRSSYSGSGTSNRINPGSWVSYKYYDDQSEDERKKQEDEKNRGKIKEVNGKEKLQYAHMEGFTP